jgi:hypothetical protein
MPNDKHVDHKDYIVPLPMDEEDFLQLATDQKKVDGYRIAILNNKNNPSLPTEAE